jgi:hypothetical protein
MVYAVPTALDEFAARFLSRAIPREEWTHLAHLRVGAWHVHHFGPDDALRRLRDGIRALNDSHGTANTDSSGYHETITVAYVRLLDRFLATFDGRVALEDRVRELLGGPLADRAVLLRFWSKELLMSPQARREWVPPDLAPLEAPLDALLRNPERVPNLPR